MLSMHRQSKGTLFCRNASIMKLTLIDPNSRQMIAVLEEQDLSCMPIFQYWTWWIVLDSKRASCCHLAGISSSFKSKGWLYQMLATASEDNIRAPMILNSVTMDYNNWLHRYRLLHKTLQWCKWWCNLQARCCAEAQAVMKRPMPEPALAQASKLKAF